MEKTNTVSLVILTQGLAFHCEQMNGDWVSVTVTKTVPYNVYLNIIAM